MFQSPRLWLVFWIKKVDNIIGTLHLWFRWSWRPLLNFSMLYFINSYWRNRYFNRRGDGTGDGAILMAIEVLGSGIFTWNGDMSTNSFRKGEISSSFKLNKVSRVNEKLFLECFLGSAIVPTSADTSKISSATGGCAAAAWKLAASGELELFWTCQFYHLSSRLKICRSFIGFRRRWCMILCELG